MSQQDRSDRFYEPQPEAPDLGASVQLETEQQLVGPGGTDPLDAGYVPPDRPYGLDDKAASARGMREGDTFDERLAREQPDEPLAAPVDETRAGRLEQDADLAATDVGVDGGAASAEEAAVHESSDPAAPAEVEPPLAELTALDDPEVDAALADDPLAEQARRQAVRDASADRDRAAGLDADPDTSGAAAPASGRSDVGRAEW
jgi:hypothetical protein